MMTERRSDEELRDGWYESEAYPIEGGMYSPYLVRGSVIVEAQSEGYIEVSADELEAILPLHPITAARPAREVEIIDGLRTQLKAATTLARTTAVTAREALAFVEQTIYANEDNTDTLTWRNGEVLALLRDISALLMGGERS